MTKMFQLSNRLTSKMSFTPKNLGGREMSSIEQGEEKKLTLTPEFSDVSYNPMFAVRNNSGLRRNMFASIAKKNKTVRKEIECYQRLV